MATLLIDVDAIELPDEMYTIADLIEAAMERAGGRGITPSAAARTARTDTTTASRVLQWMVTRQYAHTGHRGAWSHYYRGCPA